MANIVGLSSLRGNAPGRGDSGSGSDGDDDSARNQYYAGGASGRGGGSGLSVIGPDGDRPSDPMANIIGRAQRDTHAAAPSPGSARHVITFYRAGFSVNDGPYRARDDPANRPFLDALERGLVPRELEGEDVGEQVEISLVDKRHEDYVAPPAPAYTAFSGQGQTMGAAAVAADAVVQGGAEVPAARPVIDDKQPLTRLQLRLHDGRRVTESLNLSHTVRDLHAIIQLNQAGDQPYTLLAGFPPRPVSADLDQTIEAAGLKGASITQKLA